MKKISPTEGKFDIWKNRKNKKKKCFFYFLHSRTFFSFFSIVRLSRGHFRRVKCCYEWNVTYCVSNVMMSGSKMKAPIKNFLIALQLFNLFFYLAFVYCPPSFTWKCINFMSWLQLFYLLGLTRMETILKSKVKQSVVHLFLLIR